MIATFPRLHWPRTAEALNRHPVSVGAYKSQIALVIEGGEAQVKYSKEISNRW